MKKLFVILALIVCSFASYWYGVNVSSQQTYLNAKAAEAKSLVSKIQFNAELDQEEKDKLEAKINRLIIVFGHYLEEELPVGPDFYEVKRASFSLIEDVVQYRIQNPRISRGIKYSPLKEGWEFEVVEPNLKEKYKV